MFANSVGHLTDSEGEEEHPEVQPFIVIEESQDTQTDIILTQWLSFTNLYKFHRNFVLICQLLISKFIRPGPRTEACLLNQTFKRYLTNSSRSQIVLTNRHIPIPPIMTHESTDGGRLLTNAANKAFMRMMKIGCLFKFIPYNWDEETKRFKGARKRHLVLFYLHELIACYMWIYSGTRLAITFSRASSPIPDRIRTITSLWTLAYSLEMICFFQLNFKHYQIKHYANSLFSYMNGVPTSINKMGSEGKPERARKAVRKYVSAFVLLGIAMLVGNPPSHCIMVIDTPCAPHFVSSIFLPCSSADDNSATFLEKIPYILAENYLVTVMFYLWTFNWVMIFLGLAWLKMELMNLRMEVLGTDGAQGDMPQAYRALQMITVFLNDGFSLYLAWFPSILLGIVALLIFAVIKFWDLNVLSYIMFPSCGLRCVYETMTPLALAGFVNEESVRILNHWKQQVYKITERLEQKWLEAFQRSCPEIRCTAGSLYTFENSIVLTTITNCAQLTSNLLLTYR